MPIRTLHSIIGVFASDKILSTIHSICDVESCGNRGKERPTPHSLTSHQLILRHTFTAMTNLKTLLFYFQKKLSIAPKVPYNSFPEGVCQARQQEQSWNPTTLRRFFNPAFTLDSPHIPNIPLHRSHLKLNLFPGHFLTTSSVR